MSANQTCLNFPRRDLILSWHTPTLKNWKMCDELYLQELALIVNTHKTFTSTVPLKSTAGSHVPRKLWKLVRFGKMFPGLESSLKSSEVLAIF